MFISKIHLSNFRSIKDKIISFSDQISVIIGPNASGKSNLLEAIYLLSTGKSFRARIEEEMVNYDRDIARVKGKIVGLSATNLEVILTRGEIEIGTNPKRVEKAPRKKLLINGISKRLVDFAGNLKVVLFGPWDLDLVTESPSLRRKFLDSVLFQVDRDYRRASLFYDKGIRQRNKLLLRIREEGISRGQLLFWDRLLIRNGDIITNKRGEFIQFINSTKDFNGQDFGVEYDRSVISEGRLQQYADEEIAAGTTLVGPHRDDFIIRIKTNDSKHARDLARYGSRGEQRMGVLWLKIAELAYIQSSTQERPTLLLDDIFSELDHEHRDIVMEIAKNQQTIITTADPHFTKGFKKVEKIELK